MRRFALFLALFVLGIVAGCCYAKRQPRGYAVELNASMVDTMYAQGSLTFKLDSGDTFVLMLPAGEPDNRPATDGRIY